MNENILCAPFELSDHAGSEGKLVSKWFLWIILRVNVIIFFILACSYLSRNYSSSLKQFSEKL